jgi:hypothetical protein
LRHCGVRLLRPAGRKGRETPPLSPPPLLPLLPTMSTTTTRKSPPPPSGLARPLLTTLLPPPLLNKDRTALSSLVQMEASDERARPRRLCILHHLWTLQLLVHLLHYQRLPNSSTNSGNTHLLLLSARPVPPRETCRRRQRGWCR